MKNLGDLNWRVEIWAEDEDYRLPRDDRARELVKVAYVKARSAAEARRLVLQEKEIRDRWPRANAAVFEHSPSLSLDLPR